MPTSTDATTIIEFLRVEGYPPLPESFVWPPPTTRTYAAGPRLEYELDRVGWFAFEAGHFAGFSAAANASGRWRAQPANDGPTTDHVVLMQRAIAFLRRRDPSLDPNRFVLTKHFRDNELALEWEQHPVSPETAVYPNTIQIAFDESGAFVVRYWRTFLDLVRTTPLGVTEEQARAKMVEAVGGEAGFNWFSLMLLPSEAGPTTRYYGDLVYPTKTEFREARVEVDADTGQVLKNQDY